MNDLAKNLLLWVVVAVVLMVVFQSFSPKLAGAGQDVVYSQFVQDVQNDRIKTVDSASDERTANNTVRHQYRVLSAEEKEQMVAIKDAGQALIDIINAQGRSRELSLALTNAEQAVVWAVKHITA